VLLAELLVVLLLPLVPVVAAGLTAFALCPSKGEVIAGSIP
jgi:hypothetical protein